MASGISTGKEQAGHGTPFVSFSTVFNNYFLPEELPDLMNTSNQEQETYSVRKDDVFVTRTSETIDELGMSSVALKDYPQATYSGFTKRLRPKQEGEVYAKYIGFYLRGDLFRKTMTNNAFMTLRASFNEDIFSFLDLYLPEYKEQVKIGDFLYLIEKNIQVNKLINDNLQKTIQTIYDYWFTQFDYPSKNGNPYKSSGGKMIWNDEIKKEIPEGWKVKCIKDCITHINTGLNPRDNFELNTGGSIRYITVKNLTSKGEIDFSECDLITPQVKSLINKRSMVRSGDILFASISPLGRCYFVQETPLTWEINESVFSIRTDNNVLTPEYLYIFLMSDEFVKRAENSSAGSVFKGIRISMLEDMKIVVPPKEIMIAFKEIISSQLQLRYQCEQESIKLSGLRDWLLPMLMNGQVTIEN